MRNASADALTGSHPFVLGHAVHGIGVVDGIDPVLVARMHAVHAQLAGPVVGGRGAPLADSEAHRPGLGPGSGWTIPD